MIKNYSLILIVFLCCNGMGFGQTLWINEIHYDNNDTDTNEGIEIAGPAGTDLSTYTLTLYNGNGGGEYNSTDLSGTIPDEGSGFGAVWFGYPVDGIQNGSPDGIALSNNGILIQFLSYEGDFTAIGGVADGVTSTSIGGTESSSTAIGESLQLQGSGCQYSDFLWSSAIPHTQGAINTGQTIGCDEVDWCNLQFPANGNINTGNTYLVYAKVYEPGLTDVTAGDVGPTLEAWIGYSTTNENPSTWTNWVPASFFTDAGNNDEYVAEIGVSLPSGTYYYASRFRLNGGPFKYGGYDTGFWDGATNVNGVLSIDQVDWCNLQYPVSENITLGSNFDVWARVFEYTITDAPGQGPGITAWIGYSTSDSHPSTWTNWIPATYNDSCLDCNSGQDDEYSANIGAEITAPGVYYYASRFELNSSGTYRYGGILSNGLGSIWDGTTYLNGVLTVTAPEIDVERNTGASITSGTCVTNPPNTGNDTLFSATPIGDTTSSKVYSIRNEGDADLTVTSIALNSGSNFNLLTTPPLPITINPGDSVSFEIEFAPNSVGSMEDTVTIISNDPDESTYTFCVGGTGLCVAASLTISPFSGPVGTVVSIIGANFGSSTTATINGISAIPITVISPTEIEVTVPSEASTGSLQITNDLGCVSSQLFTVLDNMISACEGNSGLIPTELFISEVTDHESGHHSYVEIFNGTGATVDLTGYEIRIHNNGAATASSTVPLYGSIIDGDVFVLAFGQSDATNPHGDHPYDQSSSVSGINENDNIRLYNSTTWVDLWGDTSGNSFTIAPKNYTYRRKNLGITAPSTTWNSNDWYAFTPVDYSDIGVFDFSTGVPPSINIQPTSPNTTCGLSASFSVTATEGYNEPDDTKELVYQWYYNALGESGWTILTDSDIYSGATASTLIVSNTLGLNNYQYYCEVREDNASCYQVSNAVQLSLQMTSWNGSSWDNGVPDVNTIAVIEGDYNTGVGSVQNSFIACQLFVNSSTLTIADNTYVEVENNVKLIGTGSILVHPQAAFVQIKDTGTVEADNPDNYQVNKLTAIMNAWYEYTYWSSPTQETIGDALSEAAANRRFKFSAQDYRDSKMENNNDNTPIDGQDDIDDSFTNYSDGTGPDWQLVSGSDYMIPGIGYASTHDPNNFSSNTDCPGCNLLYTFNGLFNNGIVEVDIFRNDDELLDNNWNLVGNPYPSAISADAFLDYNAVENFSAPNPVIKGAIYLWSQNTEPLSTNNGNDQLNFSQNDYAIINGWGETATSPGGDSSSDPLNRMIPSGQGFFVAMGEEAAVVASAYNSSVDSTKLKFNNSMRVRGVSDNSQFFKTVDSPVALPNRIKVNLTSDNGVFSQILVGYLDGATDGYDGMYYDTPRNLSTGSASILYSTITGTDDKLAIQAKNTSSLDIDEVIPIGFYTTINVATLYTLSIAQLEGTFLTSNTIYLKDNLLNIYHDFSNSSYTFTSTVGEFNDRFELVFQTTALSTQDSILSLDDVTIIDMPNGAVKIKVGKDHAISQVEIIDVLGRTLYTLRGTGSEEVYFLPQLNQSAYIAKVTMTNGQTLSKKAIKKN